MDYTKAELKNADMEVVVGKIVVMDMEKKMVSDKGFAMAERKKVPLALVFHKEVLAEVLDVVKVDVQDAIEEAKEEQELDEVKVEEHEVLT